jgi:hypothetical protein
LASHFARAALSHVRREYPHKLDHILDGDHDAAPPRVLHPLFHGSFDWHSCVHGHWLLARVLRLFPDLPEAPRIRELFDRHLTSANVAAEVAYLNRPSSRGFERPYGWAWLLMLAAELLRHDAQWAATLEPLSAAFADRFKSFLPNCTYPIRAGTHANSAFALTLAHEYATIADDRALLSLLAHRATLWYAADADAQAWEPSQDDFLSPTLIEAEAMRRLLGNDLFTPWFAKFLPRLAGREPKTLFTPATVSDRTDGKIVHLDGLNLSRAWCWLSLAAALPPDAQPLAHATALEHLQVSLPHVTGHYMGEHWLATFALLALTADGTSP